MASTPAVISLLAGLLAASLLLWAVLLWVGLRWAKVQQVSWRRVGLATCLVFLLNSAANVVSHLMGQFGNAQSIPLAAAICFAIAQLAAVLLIPLVVIMLMFKTSVLRSLQAWLPTLLVPVLTVPFLLLVFRPFVLEAFVISTNAMAPTLLGRHWRAACATCGNPAYCSPAPPGFQSAEPPLMICEANFHVTRPADCDRRVFLADRILVAKYLKPERWDLIVFRYPGDPASAYVKRLVGLPGEEITIRDGQVWANGEALTPPESMRGIEYLSEMEFGREKLWGAPDKPAQLGDDEYFVLGDFSAQSRDSRFWQVGAPGHHPFAVPESHLLGVATHIYWPPSRWRAFR